MRRFLLIIGLELYALFLAAAQSYAGVRTDEAKYLLNIPYPHPPLARWLFSQLEMLPMQEMFVRVLIASVIVLAVFLIADLARDCTREQRFTLCGLYLLSMPVIMQAGTIMMAPLTAVQALVFIWIALRADAQSAGWVMMLWLASLFTAYQAALLLPLIMAYAYRVRLSLFYAALGIGVPLILLTLYTLGNPLVLASMVNAGNQNDHMTMLESIGRVATLWLMAGSIVVAVLGVQGMVRQRQWAMCASFALVLLYMVVSFRAYYAVLLIPFLVVGASGSQLFKRSPAYVLALHLIATVWLLTAFDLDFVRSPARYTMHKLQPALESGPVLIVGSFGHEWQYESRVTILQQRGPMLEALEDQPTTEAIVCLAACGDLTEEGFARFAGVPVDVWLRRMSN